MKEKPTFGAVILKVILGIIFIGFIILWVVACVGNFLNADENPASTILHF